MTRRAPDAVDAFQPAECDCILERGRASDCSVMILRYSNLLRGRASLDCDGIGIGREFAAAGVAPTNRVDGRIEQFRTEHRHCALSTVRNCYGNRDWRRAQSDCENSRRSECPVELQRREDRDVAQ